MVGEKKMGKLFGSHLIRGVLVGAMEVISNMESANRICRYVKKLIIVVTDYVSDMMTVHQL